MGSSLIQTVGSLRIDKYNGFLHAKVIEQGRRRAALE